MTIYPSRDIRSEIRTVLNDMFKEIENPKAPPTLKEALVIVKMQGYVVYKKSKKKK